MILATNHVMYGEISNGNGRYKLKKESPSMFPAFFFSTESDSAHTKHYLMRARVQSQNESPSSYLPPPKTQWDQELSRRQPRW